MIKLIGSNSRVVEVETSIFPDNQPHIKIPSFPKVNPGDKLLVKCRITNSIELMNLLLVDEVLKRKNIDYVLRIMYLMGARMDRPIDSKQPFTLKVIAEILWSLNVKLEVFDVHSKVAVNLLRAENILPLAIFRQHINDSDTEVIVIPDVGATNKVGSFLGHLYYPEIQCEKHRDERTGKLSDIKIVTENAKDIVKNKVCLIVDDICDGGGTFVGIAKLLHEAGAKEVNLFVTHGIFSKTYYLKGIKQIYTTNTYQDGYYARREPVKMLEVW